MMVENVVVGIIVGIVLALAGRSLYRTFTGKSTSCCCGNGECRMVGSCVPPPHDALERRISTSQSAELTREMNR